MLYEKDEILEKVVARINPKSMYTANEARDLLGFGLSTFSYWKNTGFFSVEEVQVRTWLGKKRVFYLGRALIRVAQSKGLPVKRREVERNALRDEGPLYALMLPEVPDEPKHERIPVSNNEIRVTSGRYHRVVFSPIHTAFLRKHGCIEASIVVFPPADEVYIIAGRKIDIAEAVDKDPRVVDVYRISLESGSNARIEIKKFVEILSKSCGFPEYGIFRVMAEAIPCVVANTLLLRLGGTFDKK